MPSEDLATKTMSENLPTEPKLENLSKKAKLENLPPNPLLSNDFVKKISNDSQLEGLDTKALSMKPKKLHNKPGLQFLRHLPIMPLAKDLSESKTYINSYKNLLSTDSKEQIPNDLKRKEIATNTISTKNSKVQSKEYSKKGHYCEVGNCFARTSREALKFFHVLRKESKNGQRKAWIDAIRTTKPLKWVCMFCLFFRLPTSASSLRGM